VRRINQWCRPLSGGEDPEGDCFLLPEFLTGAVARSQSGAEYPPLQGGWYKIMQAPFSYMVLGEYPSLGSTQLIRRNGFQQPDPGGTPTWLSTGRSLRSTHPG
jgi:hypothetical protein